MKALFLMDEINRFHWSVVKSVCLILSLIPIGQAVANVWSWSDVSSQILVGFIGFSFLCAWLLLSFFSALKMSTLILSVQQNQTSLENHMLMFYRNVPMLSLAGVVSYLAFSLSQ